MNRDGLSPVHVCHGPRCGDYGGHALSRLLSEKGIESHAVPCQSLCTYSPVVQLSGRAILNATIDEVFERLNG